MRPALIILLHLLLGLIMSLVLAVVLSRRRPAASAERGSPIWRSADQRFWLGQAMRGAGWTDVTLYTVAGQVTAVEKYLGTVPPWVELPRANSNEQPAVRAIAAGWPLPALHSWRHGEGDDSPGPGGVMRTGLGPQRVIWSDWNGGLPLDSGGAAGAVPVIPLAPIATGLTIDALAWGTLSTVIWLVPLGRAFVRRQRNRCSRCGYPVSGSTPCPECGVSPGETLP